MRESRDGLVRGGKVKGGERIAHTSRSVGNAPSPGRWSNGKALSTRKRDAGSNPERSITFSPERIFIGGPFSKFLSLVTH